MLRAVKPMASIARAKEMGETQGFVKVLVDADTDRFLGAAVLGVHGDEVIGLFALAMAAGMTTARFRRVVLPHPTVGELMPFVLDGLEPLGGHQAGRRRRPHRAVGSPWTCGRAVRVVTRPAPPPGRDLAPG